MGERGNYIIYGLLLVVAIATLIFSLLSFFNFQKGQKITAEVIASSQMPSRMSRMSLTGFDTELAKQFMDKNNDGMCDICGMPVEQCIDGGQLECSMDPNAKIGILGSQHIHADWKVYINGKSLDLSDKSHMARIMSNQPVSSFIHVDSGAPQPEKTGEVIHMHATGVPLWIFFKSVGIDFNKDCITIENNQYCNNENKKIRFFVNGKENKEFENYVFNDLDKILISYGSENGEEIKKQVVSITDFAKIH